MSKQKTTRGGPAKSPRYISPDEIPRYEAEERAAGRHPDHWHPMPGGNIVAVRSYGTAEELTEVRARRYLGLPPC